MDFKQAERLPTDGSVGVELDEDYLIICVDHPGVGTGRACVRVSFFNAARIFGLLALFLGIRLPAKLSKAIRL